MGLPLLAACLPMHGMGETTAEKIKIDPAQTLFVAGLDHFDAGRRTDEFTQLEQRFPASPWTLRSRTLAGLAAKIRMQEKRLKRQKRLLEARQQDQATLKELKQQKELLQEQVKTLKSLIVDLELRQP